MKGLKLVLVITGLAILGSLAFLYGAPQTATGLAIRAERSMAGLERHELTLPSGLTYVYLEGGEGEPMLLLHGFGANKDNFTRVARDLTNDYRIIAPDHIGFGESSKPADAAYDSAAQAARLHAFMNQLQLGPVHLGGSSMGGHIAMAYTAEHPERVESLWLLNPGGVWSAPPGEMRRHLKETGEHPLLAPTEADFRRVFDFVMSQPPFVPGPMLDVMARERIANHGLEETIYPQLESDPIEARARTIQVPTLIVWGEEDRALNPAAGPILADIMPNARLIMMPQIGHLPMLEAPGQVVQDYREFLQGLAGKSE